MRDPGNGKRRKNKPAYPRPGTGEDFPAQRPGTKVGETRSGGKVMQSTRASQARRATNRPREAFPIPPATPRRGDFRVGTSPWRGRGPSGTRRYPFSHGVRGKATRRNPWPL
jgi:hypothetical protein